MIVKHESVFRVSFFLIQSTIFERPKLLEKKINKVN